MNSVKLAAGWTYRILIALFAAGVIVEVFLAGLGVFRAMPADDKSVSHEAFDAKFDAHAVIGDVLFAGSLLLLIVILVAWPGLRWFGATLGLAVLTFAQGALGGTGEDAPVAGAFHATNALLILGLSLVLAAWAWRGGVLAQPMHVGQDARLPSAEDGPEVGPPPNPGGEPAPDRVTRAGLGGDQSVRTKG